MPYRPKPDDLNFSKDNHSVVFRSLETDKNVKEEKQSTETTETGEAVAAPAVGFASEFEVVWKCPGAGFGGIVILVNYKVRGTGEWFELKYSLKESPIR